MNNGSKKWVKKIKSTLNNLQSVLGVDWEDEIYETKSKILNGDQQNILDCLLHTAVTMKSLLVEGQRFFDDNEEDDCNEDRDRDYNLMVFGEWEEKQNYDDEISELLTTLEVSEQPLNTTIVQRTKTTTKQNNVSFCSIRALRQ